MDKINSQHNTEIPQTPFAYFWYISKPYKWWMYGSIFVVILASVLGQASAYFFKLIVDAIEVNSYQQALKFALLYPIVIFVMQLMYRFSGLLGRMWTINAEKYSTDTLTKYLLKHSHSFFVDRFAGSLLSKVGNVNGAVNQLIPDLLWTHLTSLSSLVVTLGFLLFIDIKTAGIFFGLIVVLIIFNRRLAPTKTKYSRATAEFRTSLRGRLVDIISNVQAVRQYVQDDREESSINDLSTKVKEAQNLNWGYTEKMLLWNTCILFIFSLAMFWLLVEGWNAGNVTTGDLVLILALYSQITGTLIFIGRAFNSAAQTIGEMEEGLEDILVPVDIEDTEDAFPLKCSQASIDWKSVIFKYDQETIFSDFNLAIPAGQRLGLVGRSGAGKSTFVSLLLRQHDISSGSIEIDGQNISDVTQESLRKNIAVVPQEPALFHRSIRDNILYGKPNATEAELIEVAKKAQAHDFITALPDGYDTLVGERGVKLSGGQKQRVAIARAMLKDAPILILDEATSALDSESEVAIQKALEGLMEGRTVIAIAHRLSTLRKMDRIIVMEEGRIVEDGSHEQLTISGGVYEKLWNHQAGGFLQED